MKTGWCCLIVVLSVLPGYGQAVVALFNVSGDRQVGTIDPSTGAATLFGSPLNGSSMASFGGSGYDSVTNRVYFVGNPGSVNTVFNVALPAGTASTVGLSGNTPNSVEYDSGEATIYALFSISGDRQLGTIDPVTGAVALLGSPIGGVPISTSANASLDESGNRMFFVGTPTAGVASVYTVNTGTGSATVQALSLATISLLAYNSSNTTLYALANISGGRQLASINPGTGAVTLIGSPLDGGASISTSSDVIAIDGASGVLHFVGNSTSIYSVSLATGAGSSQTIIGGGSSVVSLEYDPGAVPVTLSHFSID